jgi:general secretion pathway protein A
VHDLSAGLRKYFGLRDDPFSVSPDPRFLYSTPATDEAFASLVYGVQKRKGFVLLTGEVGTGKTTLLNKLLDCLHKERVPTAFVFNPLLDTNDFLDFVMTDLGIEHNPADKGQMLMALNRWLLEQNGAGKTAVLIVDEAQTLSVQVLEEVRLLTNLETAKHKLLQIVLSGQPELEEKLRRPELRQLRQRIALWCRTRPLTPAETRAYLSQRLRIAGGDIDAVFTPEAIDTVHRFTHGFPRLINNVCDQALVAAYIDEQKPVRAETIEQLASEFQLDEKAPLPRPLPPDLTVGLQPGFESDSPEQAVEEPELKDPAEVGEEAFRSFDQPFDTGPVPEAPPENFEPWPEGEAGPSTAAAPPETAIEEQSERRVSEPKTGEAELLAQFQGSHLEGASQVHVVAEANEPVELVLPAPNQRPATEEAPSPIGEYPLENPVGIGAAMGEPPLRSTSSAEVESRQAPQEAFVPAYGTEPALNRKPSAAASAPATEELAPARRSSGQPRLDASGPRLPPEPEKRNSGAAPLTLMAPARSVASRLMPLLWAVVALLCIGIAVAGYQVYVGNGFTALIGRVTKPEGVKAEEVQADQPAVPQFVENPTGSAKDQTKMVADPGAEAVQPISETTRDESMTRPAGSPVHNGPAAARTQTPLSTKMRAPGGSMSQAGFSELAVTSNVDGATVSLDGQSKPDWITPRTLSGLSPGPHKVSISKQGYKKVERVVNAIEGETTLVYADLRPVTGEVEISTEPPGAQVLIDGRSIGPSPIHAEIHPGPHSYVVQAEGRVPVSGEFTVEDYGVTTLKLDLPADAPPAPAANVQLNSTPSGASVYADGNPVGGPTPTTFRLEPGRHSLIISLAGYRPVRREVEVPAKGTLSISEALARQ